MTGIGRIVTIGLCPCWDAVCKLDGVDWGEHKVVSASSASAAGKALNISRALAWMGQRSAAAGLWGKQDYERMLKDMAALKGLVEVRFTAVEGRTRQNITIVDTVKKREMHLRQRSELASKTALRRLRAHLLTIVDRNSVCVFAGAMPGSEFLDDVIEIVNCCAASGGKIVLDTSGDALKEIVETSAVWMIKPNVGELRALLGEEVMNRPVSLAKAGGSLLDKIEIVLISRGEKGAIVVTKKGASWGQCAERRRVLSTVGCGDYLLAGFLKGLKDRGDEGAALEVAIKAATAKAWGLADKMQWRQAEREIEVAVKSETINRNL